LKFARLAREARENMVQSVNYKHRAQMKIAFALRLGVMRARYKVPGDASSCDRLTFKFLE
jgi:hypothetical protein